MAIVLPGRGVHTVKNRQENKPGIHKIQCNPNILSLPIICVQNLLAKHTQTPLRKLCVLTFISQCESAHLREVFEGL